VANLDAVLSYLAERLRTSRLAAAILGQRAVIKLVA